MGPRIIYIKTPVLIRFAIAFLILLFLVPQIIRVAAGDLSDRSGEIPSFSVLKNNGMCVKM